MKTRSSWMTPASCPNPKTRIWATKGISVWALLSAILIRTRPESILEFGGGRSTTFLADYSFRFKKRGVTIEESEVWRKKILNDLSFMQIQGYPVHLAPLSMDADRPWYDLDIVDRVVDGFAFDLVFIDGPAYMPYRNNLRGQSTIRAAAREARLVICDDVQQPDDLEFFMDLATRFPTEGKFFYQYNKNVIALAAAPEWSSIVKDCFEFLRMNYTHAMPLVPPLPTGDTPQLVSNRGKWFGRLWDRRA
jgi:hypothetical protein